MTPLQQDREPGLSYLDEQRAGSVADEGGASALLLEQRRADGECERTDRGLRTLAFLAISAFVALTVLATARRPKVLGDLASTPPRG
jgi:hypothetical protein